MPFTANRAIQEARRACSRAPKACTTGRPTAARCSTARAGLWCVNAGHGRAEDRRGDQRAGRRRWTSRRRSRWATRSPSSSPTRWSRIAPEGLDHVFFTNSGSESVDTALKIALAYHRARGEGAAHAPDRPRARLPRRRLRRHLGRRHRSNNRKASARCCRGVDHLRHTHDLGAKRVLARPARAWRRARRRPGAARRAARRVDHRGGHRRAGGGIDRRAGAAEGLSGAAARDLRRSTASC